MSFFRLLGICNGAGGSTGGSISMGMVFGRLEGTFRGAGTTEVVGALGGNEDCRSTGDSIGAGTC